jgi:hypothetical protein
VQLSLTAQFNEQQIQMAITAFGATIQKPKVA